MVHFMVGPVLWVIQSSGTTPCAILALRSVAQIWGREPGPNWRRPLAMACLVVTTDGVLTCGSGAHVTLCFLFCGPSSNFSS